MLAPAGNAAFLSEGWLTVASVRVQEARLLSWALLDDPGLRRRWSHVQAVARRAEELAGQLRLDDEDAEVLVAAAWLHDCGYSPLIAAGFHPVDGARYLRRFGAPETVCCLVANHSGAAVEAEVRGRSAELAEFPAVGGVIDDVAAELIMSLAPCYALLPAGILQRKVGGRNPWRVERARLEAYIERAHAETAAYVRANPLGRSEAVTDPDPEL